MTPEEDMHTRVVEERARRIAIQATVSRRVDERIRMIDPAERDQSHAEHVRSLVVLLGELGALDPIARFSGLDALKTDAAVQETLVDLAAEIQDWMENIARDAAR